MYTRPGEASNSPLHSDFLSKCTITSPETSAYNSYAWAIGGEKDGRWWSPEPFNQYYWPKGLPQEETLGAYLELCKLHGYIPCDGNREEPEVGFEKIAIYALTGVPKHSSRQLEDGRWTSKLGKGHDVVHDTLSCLEGETFGFVCKVLKRPL